MSVPTPSCARSCHFQSPASACLSVAWHHADGRIWRRGGESRSHVQAERCVTSANRPICWLKPVTGGHCVKLHVGAKVLTYLLLLPCGGFAQAGWVSSQHCRWRLCHDKRGREHPASRRPVKGVSLPFIRYTQRSPWRIRRGLWMEGWNNGAVYKLVYAEYRGFACLYGTFGAGAWCDVLPAVLSQGRGEAIAPNVPSASKRGRSLRRGNSLRRPVIGCWEDTYESIQRQSWGFI